MVVSSLVLVLGALVFRKLLATCWMLRFRLFIGVRVLHALGLFMIFSLFGACIGLNTHMVLSNWLVRRRPLIT